ncbi:MAG: asparagine synthase (glutamine-hydrolyzing) [Acidobacteria bacterium]|nr:asparagine synthase (glutamine-hydrolyzing) [Acidobacteriota bacterium]
MCGICGIVNFNADEPVDPGLLQRMTDVMVHRGPDDGGVYLDGNVGLGHRRLSIIDLSGGKQPIFNEDGSAVIVFNGEVYNFASLTSELVSQGHTFRTRSDTEAIIHAYEQHGDECVQRLRGMFGFAIWDRAARRMFIARDRLGVKPIYYYQDSNTFAFASELKSLLELPSVPRELDPEALDIYLSLRYVPGPRTMFKNIFKLQPGHTLVCDKNGVRTSKYWDVPYDPDRRADSATCLEEFQELLEESVRLRLIAEVPLGVFLSGGLDSSSILAVMNKITGGERIKTFSVGYQGGTAEEQESNEFYYARMAARAFGAEHHEFRVSAPDFGNFIPDLVWHLDEPMADPSCIPLYFISKLARKHITVVLSGEGADETLAGYSIYPKMLALDRAHKFLAPLPSMLAPYLSHLIPSESYRSYMRMAGLRLESRYYGISRAFRPELKRQLLPHWSRDSRKSEDSVRAVLGAYFRQVRRCAPLDQMLYVDTKVWLPDDILLKADKMTMANSLELRVPFLDHKLVEFAAALAPELKLQGGRGKFILRQAMQGVLPQEILERGKKGFPVPTAEWLRAPLKAMTRDVLLSNDSACRTYLNAKVLERIVDEHERGAVKRDQEIWTLLVFEFWHRLFLERRLERGARREPLVEVA